MLLLLLLPLEQPLHPLQPYHLAVNDPCRHLLPLDPSTDLVDAFGEVNYVELVAVVVLLIAIAVLALVAEERPAVTARVDADVGQGLLGVLGTTEGQTPDE